MLSNAATTSDPPMLLWVPELLPDTDALTAALAYAAAGWYVLPARRGTKNPGSACVALPIGSISAVTLSEIRCARTTFACIPVA